MPHRAEFDRIMGLLIRALHTLIAERSASRGALRKWLREPMRVGAAKSSAHAMPHRRAARAA